MRPRRSPSPERNSLRRALTFDSPTGSPSSSSPSPSSSFSPSPMSPRRPRTTARSSPERRPPRTARRTQPTEEQLESLTLAGGVSFLQQNLTEVPDWIMDYSSQIITLDLSENNISSLPPDIFEQLTQLEGLTLSYNQITSLPPHIFDKNTKLAELHISHNQLKSLPPHIFKNLRKLVSLDLSYNLLSQLPPNIFQNTPRIEELILSGNRLINFPIEMINHLENLNELELQYNLLSRQNVEEIDEFASEVDGLNIGNIYIQEGRQGGGSMPRSPLTNSAIAAAGLNKAGSAPEINYTERVEVTCLNNDDILGIDDFSKGYKEFEAPFRVIILQEGNAKNGHCFPIKSLIKSLLALNDGIPTTGPWEDINVMGDYATERFFKLPFGQWIDLDGFRKIVEGNKILRLKRKIMMRIGSLEYGIGALHGNEEQIYTLVNVKSTYSGRNPALNIIIADDEDNYPHVYFKADDNFLENYFQF